jgi:hypothetical protein
MENFKYQNKALSEFTLEQLYNIKAGLDAAHNKRNEAASHEKFTMDREIGNKKISKMNFPEPNVNFINLKNAIIEEIKNRNKSNA